MEQATDINVRLVCIHVHVHTYNVCGIHTTVLYQCTVISRVLHYTHSYVCCVCRVCTVGSTGVHLLLRDERTGPRIATPTVIPVRNVTAPAL